MNTKQLKDAIRTKHAWPGGYTLFGVCSDGGVLCCKCMRENFRLILWSVKNNVSDGWKVDGIDHSGNLEPREWIEEHSEEYSLLFCDHCNDVLND